MQLFSSMTSDSKLYKYLDIEGGLKMLQNRNLQFTNANYLNDPFDCHPSLFDYSKVPVNEYNLPPADFLKEKGILDMENLRNSAWICSLSKVHDSLLMWAYYGNHKGVCIGLDMEKANKYLSKIFCKLYSGARKIEVQYKDVIEKPDYFRDFGIFYDYLLSTKAKAWEHEQEVRLVLLDPIPAGIASPPFFAPLGVLNKPRKRQKIIDWKEVRLYPHLGGECFDSLYLGINMADDKKERIIEAARRCNPDIKIYQMKVDSEAFQLKEELFFIAGL